MCPMSPASERAFLWQTPTASGIRESLELPCDRSHMKRESAFLSRGAGGLKRARLLTETMRSLSMGRRVPSAG